MKKKNRKDEKPISRRAFMGGAAATGAAISQGCGTFHIVPRAVLGGAGFKAPSEKLNIASIGCGGKGHSDMRLCMGENVVALCDVDSKRAAGAFRDNPGAKRYTDYREMLAERDDLDAVIVSTPDHSHASAALMAMKKGLHVYVQKPLTHSINEARTLREAARKYGVVTQMGNQGTGHDGLREAVEVIHAGTIGHVREIHVWTNRPIWPQAIERPTEVHKVPATLKWDLFLGPAPDRPYNKAYHPFDWRGWWDFGTGALGDMACHTANMAFMAMNLGYPTRVEARTSARYEETGPKWSIIHYEFPRRGSLPPCTMTWYDGGKLPPQDLVEGAKFSGSGSLLVGDRGTMYSPHDYGERYRLLPEADFKDFEPPAPTLPRLSEAFPEHKGNVDHLHHLEWIAACKGQMAAMSNFDYSALLTESVLLGNVAVRMGHKIDWNGRKMVASNCTAARDIVQREYREGYTL